MRTNIVIDDQLMTRAMRAGGYKTKRDTVQAGLELLLQLDQQRRIRDLRGQLQWEGDLDSMRRD